MNTPFSKEQFFKVFEDYNSAVFPAQWIILFISVVCVFWIFSGRQSAGTFTGFFIGILWVWVGVVYHLEFFATINPLATVFGALFILQGFLTLLGSIRGEFHLARGTSAKDYFGYLFLFFGLFVYPLISFYAEGSFNRTIMIGLPCPTVIVTFGFFLLYGVTFPRYLLIIPSAWAILGVSAAINFGVYQDFALPLSALLADTFILMHHRSSRERSIAI